jgi:hypothetical protein
MCCVFSIVLCVCGGEVPGSRFRVRVPGQRSGDLEKLLEESHPSVRLWSSQQRRADVLLLLVAADDIILLIMVVINATIAAA